MMNTQILEYIIAISEEKSLSRAADRLLVTQPALSQQLKKLEKDLDARLFQRVKNELVLTDAGRVYVNGARSMLRIHENALTEIYKLRDSGKKQITMVYNNALLPAFSTEILPPFMELHKGIFISTVNGNSSIAKDYLANGMADIAVMATREPSHSMLEYIPLREEELMLAMAADHPKAEAFRREGVDFSCLKNEYFILNQTNSYFRILEKEILGACRFTPHVLCEISDLDASRHMVIHHRGIAFLPRSMEQEEGGYVCFPLNPPVVFHVTIAYHKGTLLSKPLKDLITLLLKASIH